MILETETVEQAVDRDRSGHFIKDSVVAHGPHCAIGMVRKRAVGVRTRGAVLLVHGFAQNRYTWHCSRRSLVNELASRGFDVFNMDLRGRGRSRRYGARLARTLDDYIREDVPACVRTILSISEHARVFLVGHSMGGMISYCAAGSELREQVAGVVTIGSPYRFGRGSAVLRVVGPLFYGLRLTGLFDTNFPIPLGLAGRHLRGFRRLWDSRLFPFPIKVWHPGSMEPELLDEYLRLSFEHTRLEVALGIVRPGPESVLRSHDGMVDYGAAFELLDRPLLVIAGSEDTLAPPESVKPAYELSQASDRTYRCFPMGHVDLIMGRNAPSLTWPLLVRWLEGRTREDAAGSVPSEGGTPA